tara:strand:+ start:31633 stop:32769 length:1137 start_codon:yes stop_codon:yes gene_type:complete
MLNASVSTYFSRRADPVLRTRRAALTRHTAIFGWIAAALWLLALAGTARALPVDGLYSHEVAVSSQSEVERRRAYREALAQVIVKVTGERIWLDHPRISAAVNNADEFVAQVSYRTRGTEALIEVRFDREQLDELLNREDIPVWDNNRASVLLWITVQAADGRRTMLGSSSEHELLDQARLFASERAVPVLIPLLDLTDRRMVTPDKAWALDSEALRSAANRYGADSVLAARVLEAPDGQLVGLWKFLFRDNEEIFDHIEFESQTYMDLPLDNVTSRLASHFGLVRSTLDRRDQVALRVDGISDLDNHLRLVRYLESLSVVRAVSIAGLRADGVELQVQLAGTRQMLTEFISLERDLQEQNFQLGESLPELLHYRWTR